MRSCTTLIFPALSLLIACGAAEEPNSGGSTPTTPGLTEGSAGTGGAIGQAELGGSAGMTAASGGATGGTPGSEAGAGAGGTVGQGGDSAAAGAGTGGAGGESTVDENGDTIPWRELNVTVPAGIYEHNFRPNEADPAASPDFQNDAQLTGLDTNQTLQGKLLIDFGFNRGERLDYFVSRGFHVLAIDFAGVNEVGDIVELGEDDPNAYGDIRLESLEGVDHTPHIDVSYSDSAEGHITEGLKFLHATYPGEDWGYYLNEDGTVRYSDVILTGLSHGATSIVRFAMRRRFWRVVSSSGPRDNTCGTNTDDNSTFDPACAAGTIASWLNEVPVTPIDRLFALTGTGDSQHGDILFTMETIGYIGEPVNVSETAPPYNGSHRLIANANHERFCNDPAYYDACDYMFGVTP